MVSLPEMDGPTQRLRLRAEVEGKRKNKKKEVEGRGSPAVEGVHGAGLAELR